MGQIVDWSDVVTEGSTIEECRSMLKDALHEMVLAYQQQNKEIPTGNCFFEQIPAEVAYVSQAFWFNQTFGDTKFLSVA